MHQKGLAPIPVLVAIGSLIAVVAAIFLYIQKDSSLTFIRPKEKTMIKNTKAKATTPPTTALDPKTGLPKDGIEPAKQNLYPEH